MSFPYTWHTLLFLLIGVVLAMGFAVRLPARGSIAALLTGLPVLGVLLTQVFC